MGTEEKSVWVQLLSMVCILGSYLVVAGLMLSDGTTVITEFVPLFISAVVLLIAVLAAGHTVISVLSRPEGRDERDRLIGWRAESNSSWILGVGVLAAITGLVLSVEPVWIAHLLLLSMFLSEVARFVLRLLYYRRGM